MKKLFLSALMILIVLLSSFVCANDIIDSLDIEKPTPAPIGNSGDKVVAILGAFQWVGYAIAIGMLVFLGIKYVLASADERSDLKTSFIKYVMGAILIAGATTIGSIIFNLLK